MALSKSVAATLNNSGLTFKLHPHQQGVGLEQIIGDLELSEEEVLRGVLLNEEGGGILLAVLPGNRLIDFKALESETGKKYSPVPVAKAKRFFPDCADATIPPIAGAYRLEALIDESVECLDKLYFEGGAGKNLVEMAAEDFLQLNRGNDVKCFSRGEKAVALSNLSAESEKIDAGSLTPAVDAKKRLERLYKLPPIPEMAVKIIKLRNDPNSDAQKLADIVELDPSLAAQVMRYANSAFFGFRGELDSIKSAISRVLGFDLVMNMALGLAAGSSLRNPPDGPLGLKAFWRHATYSAALAQKLARKMPAELEVKPGMAYLSALLHNFGFLLLGHLFQPEFFLLNKMVAANPGTSIVAMEKHALGMGQAQHVLGMGHAELGGWLMETWSMPEEVIVSVKEHHNYAYDGDYAAYPLLIAVINMLLAKQGMGDESDEGDYETICLKIGLDPKEAVNEVEMLFESSESLDEMAEQFAA